MDPEVAPDIPHSEPARPGGSAWKGWAAAGVLLLVTAWLGWVNFELRGRVEDLLDDRDLAVAKANRLDLNLQRARADLRRLQLAQRIAAAPGAGTVRLAGLDRTPAASAATWVDPATGRAAFLASDLPPPPPQRTYQLWFIADGVPVSAGVFDVEADGSALVLVEDLVPAESIQAWAVTVEPEGGVPQPTGEMVLKG